ncbi:hypothetical protein P6U16_16330 [Rhizobium sp. 32-5/1]|uniref:hypothetical protein n=1 Tax=Rhizobium sp. 32-5/1 TaxID=3019602 RepID=UPI00240D420C|nr:hypothetical protein [Rhizobium sp. 32-5/1]WEZ82610.1 hypothetical protein P6U16_16330 [Rhizobium sp. 32-5/1]
MERGEGWFEDPSNDSLRFERVRVRQALAESGEAGAQDEEGGPAERLAVAKQAAAFLAAHARVYDRLVARIDPVGADACSGGAAMKAILSLAACLGGRAYLPGRETTDRMRRFIDSGLDGRQTAGRVVFDRRRFGLYLYREARDLPDLRLESGEDCIWDGRFHMRNRSKRVMSASAGTIDTQTVAGLIAAGVPHGVARRAVRASPPLSMAGTEIATATPVNIEVCLSPWDTFLPRFDMILANQCAALLGREPYKPLPVHHVFAETAGF